MRSVPCTHLRPLTLDLPRCVVEVDLARKPSICGLKKRHDLFCWAPVPTAGMTATRTRDLTQPPPGGGKPLAFAFLGTKMLHEEAGFRDCGSKQLSI